jgi:hypothetical protein
LQPSSQGENGTVSPLFDETKKNPLRRRRAFRGSRNDAEAAR